MAQVPEAGTRDFDQEVATEIKRSVGGEVPTQQSLPKVIPFGFTGRTGVYVRIYFTNLLLNVITLSIYSPWAKIRNKRFFYGNTSLLGSSFDFDASPVAILVARMLLLACFGAVIYAQERWQLFIGEYGFSSLLLILLLPLLTVRGRAFNFRHTILRGVRFSYDKRYLPSYCHLFLLVIPFIATITLIIFQLTLAEEGGEFPPFLKFLIGEEDVEVLTYALSAYLILLWPLNHWWQHRIRINQLNFGKLKFRFTATLGSYAMIYFFHLLILFGAAAVIGWLELEMALAGELVEDEGQLGLALSMILLIYLTIISFLSHLGRRYWDGIATTEGSRLVANYSPLAYAFWIVLVNNLIAVLSFGWLVPWARMRRWRYLAKRIHFLPSENLHRVMAASDSFETAIGSESMDMEGFEFDFGII